MIYINGFQKLKCSKPLRDTLTVRTFFYRSIFIICSYFRRMKYLFMSKKLLDKKCPDDHKWQSGYCILTASFWEWFGFIIIIIEFSSPKCTYVKYRNTKEYMFKNDYIPRSFDELYRPPAVVDMTSCGMKFDYRLC